MVGLLPVPAERIWAESSGCAYGGSRLFARCGNLVQPTRAGDYAGNYLDAFHGHQGIRARKQRDGDHQNRRGAALHRRWCATCSTG
ncbi:hypothetical protein D3C84_852150 [compost metagenome]